MVATEAKPLSAQTHPGVGDGKHCLLPVVPCEQHTENMDHAPQIHFCP